MTLNEIADLDDNPREKHANLYILWAKSLLKTTAKDYRDSTTKNRRQLPEQMRHQDALDDSAILA